VVLSGAIVSVVALASAFVIQPLIQRWVDREAEIAMKAEQLARVRSLVERKPEFQGALTGLREAQTVAGRRLLEGNTAAVAASGLQLLLNRYAEESRVLLQRIDVVGVPEADTGQLVPIPARLSGSADIYGLVDLLFYLQEGEKLLVIDDFRAGSIPGLGGASGLINWAITLHGYYGPAAVRS